MSSIEKLVFNRVDELFDHYLENMLRRYNLDNPDEVRRVTGCTDSDFNSDPTVFVQMDNPHHLFYMERLFQHMALDKEQRQAATKSILYNSCLFAMVDSLNLTDLMEKGDRDNALDAIQTTKECLQEFFKDYKPHPKEL